MRTPLSSVRLIRSPLLALAGIILLTGCGGSSGGGTVTGGTPAPTPAATPTATAEQLEDLRSTGAIAARADAAYRAGATGRGVKIAVIDTGITPDLAEFAGRIDPASADMAGNRGLVDPGGHGTPVSAAILAARDGRGMHGIAYEATLVSFNVASPTNCTSIPDCNFVSQAMIDSVDAAIAARVRVINMSFNFSVTYDAFVAAVQRAAAAGIVIVISAGNNDAGGREPLLMARSFAEAAPGSVIIAGGHDALGGFDHRTANQAGSGPSSAWYLTTLSRDVNVTMRDGSVQAINGTSVSAATISGAVALVAQARPNLTGRQIVALLLANAADAGAPGIDPVFGNGILDLSRVFAALPANASLAAPAP